jgi:hypothetical protein
MRQSAAALPPVAARPARAIKRKLSILDILAIFHAPGAASKGVEIGSPSRG